MLEESLSCSSPKAPVHQYGSLGVHWGIHGAQWGVWNMEKKAEWEEQKGIFILKEECVCPKELSFRIKAVFSLLACSRDAVFPKCSPQKHSPCPGERHSGVFKTELALSLHKKDKPVKTVLT